MVFRDNISYLVYNNTDKGNGSIYLFHSNESLYGTV